MRGMRGASIGILLGAIFGSKRRKKNDGQYHQSGGILLYLIIPAMLFLCSLNSLLGNADSGSPDYWIIPLFIFLFTIGLIVLIAWARYEDRKSHVEEMEKQRHQKKSIITNIKTGAHT